MPVVHALGLAPEGRAFLVAEIDIR